MAFDATERLNGLLCAGAIAVSAAVATPHFTASVALGAALEMANYRALRRSAERFFAGQLGGSGAWAGGFGLRFGFLGGVMAAALWAGAHPVGLVLGLSLIVPAVVIAALRAPPAAPAPPAPDDPTWDRWNPWLAREHAADDEEAP